MRLVQRQDRFRYVVYRIDKLCFMLHLVYRIDAAYCYTCHTFRGLRVCLCVEHTGELYKTAEPIEIPFGRLTRVDTRNSVLTEAPLGEHS